MIPPKVSIEIDEKAIQQIIEKELEKQVTHQLLLIDINKLAEITCMSKSFLENEMLHDPRMKIIERRKEKGKRFWFYEQALEVIKEIMDEWN